MGLILDIIDKVVPRVQERVKEGQPIKSALREELEKEIDKAPLIKQGKESYKNNIRNILKER